MHSNITVIQRTSQHEVVSWPVPTTDASRCWPCCVRQSQWHLSLQCPRGNCNQPHAACEYVACPPVSWALVLQGCWIHLLQVHYTVVQQRSSNFGTSVRFTHPHDPFLWTGSPYHLHCAFLMAADSSIIRQQLPVAMSGNP